MMQASTNPALNHELRLADAPVCQPLRVSRVTEQADESTRLKAMGLCVGRRVELLQVGDPLIARVVGARIAISPRLADLIHVRQELA